jgi:hypothetical protein
LNVGGSGGAFIGYNLSSLSGFTDLLTMKPRVAAYLNSQTDLPATILAANTTSHYATPYCVLLPV